MSDKLKDQPEQPEPAAPQPGSETQDAGTDPGVPEGPGKKPPPPSNP